MEVIWTWTGPKVVWTGPQVAKYCKTAGKVGLARAAKVVRDPNACGPGSKPVQASGQNICIDVYVYVYVYVYAYL